MDQSEITENLSIEEVFEAYYECRKTKRYSSSALSFEVNYEENLIDLYGKLCSRTWKPGKSSCFIVTEPVRREIFAAPFVDRIVHHILINRLNIFFEKYFIHDSYACRVGKGTHAAIARVEHFIRSESKNGTVPAYVLKLDIKGFFMNINRQCLYERMIEFLDNLVSAGTIKRNINFEKYLLNEIIFNDCSQNCMFRSPAYMWNELPRDKSLFTTKEGCGLPIGNLTSQVFANFYLSALDHFVKNTPKVSCYVRYVDDCVFVSRNRSYLRRLIPAVRSFLKKELQLQLNPKKVYLQSVYNGVSFLGCYIRPVYTVCSKRVKNNFFRCLKRISSEVCDKVPSWNEKCSYRASINSYLGIMGKYKSYRFRTKWFKIFFEPNIKKWVKITAECLKISL